MILVQENLINIIKYNILQLMTFWNLTLTIIISNLYQKLNNFPQKKRNNFFNQKPLNKLNKKNMKVKKILNKVLVFNKLFRKTIYNFK